MKFETRIVVKVEYSEWALELGAKTREEAEELLKEHLASGALYEAIEIEVRQRTEEKLPF